MRQFLKWSRDKDHTYWKNLGTEVLKLLTESKKQLKSYIFNWINVKGNAITYVCLFSVLEKTEEGGPFKSLSYLL